MVTRPLYFDYQATTPLDSRVAAAMRPYLDEKFGNPHSDGHILGWEAEEAVEQARHQVADAIGASSKEIIFTSGATESNNLALKGLAGFYAQRKRRIVTVATEHKCVLESADHLAKQGYELIIIPVEKDGMIDWERLDTAITRETLVVSIMAVNNEIGVIHPLDDIGRLCRSRGAFFHSDCVQALGRLPLDVEAAQLDLVSLSAHKIYGPKGIGALYVRRRPRVRLMPLFSGGGQERGLRSGTLSPALCVGFGQAATLAVAEQKAEEKRLASLRDHLVTRLKKAEPGLWINGSMKNRIPGNLNIRFEGLRGDILLRSLEGMCLSTGSACSSAEIDPSYVLKALGLNDEQAQGGLRISLGRQTTREDIDQLAQSLTEAVERLREQKAPAVRMGS